MEEINIIHKNQEGFLIQTEFKPKSETLKTRKVRTWTPQEDKLLLKFYDQSPKQWSIISSLMSERNQNQCLHRFRRLSISGNQKKIWQPEEDQIIKRMVKKIGKNWKFLAEVLKTKTGKQIRERYINKLDPKIKSEEWSESEDHKLLELFCIIGSKWSEISKHLPGRPQNKIKNRFYSYIKKNYSVREHLISSKEELPLRQKKQQNKQLTEEKEEKPLADFSERYINLNYDDQKMPSIRQFQIEIKPQYLSEDKENNKNSFIRSFMRLDQDWTQKKESLRDIVSFTNILGDHDLFFLSNH